MKRLKLNLTTILLPIVLVLVIFSCESANNKFDKRIIGDWGIYVSFGSTVTYCNACPRINFMENKTATLTLPTNKKEYYDWNLQEYELTLIPQNEENIENYFGRSKYEIEIKDKEEFIELKLLKTKESGYILRK